MNVAEVFHKVEWRLTKIRTSRTVAMRNARPIVSFTFDDFPKSAVNNGARLLDENGVAGTFFFCKSFADQTVDGIRYYESADLRALVEAGHEIGCHTAGHLRVSRFANGDIIDDIEANSAFLAEQLPDYTVSTFAYPFGDINMRTKTLLQNYFVACRSIHERLNVGMADLGTLRASKLYSAMTNADKLRKLIRKAAAQNAWLILYTHDVDEIPSPCGCTPALLNIAIKMAIAEGCEILTIKDALGAIGFSASPDLPLRDRLRPDQTWRMETEIETRAVARTALTPPDFKEVEPPTDARQKVAVIIVAFRNPGDIVTCLRSLANADPTQPFDVYICENGGPAAYSADLEALGSLGYAVQQATTLEPTENSAFFRVATSSMTDKPITVHIGEAKDNFGYGGGVNAWIKPLLPNPEWKGFWILNPDTIPDPMALKQLVNYGERYGIGMVGGRLVYAHNPEIIASRGLQLNFWKASTIGIDKFHSSSKRPNRADVDRRIDSPSGASFYISHDCVRRIGLMPEDYFLFFEDIEWGLRAKSASGVGYAHDAIVKHIGGTTIGSAGARGKQSKLAVYLEFRNRLVFIRRNYPVWLPWTALMLLAHAFEFLAVGAWTNFRAALAGWKAGLANETGRPDHLTSQPNK